MTYAEEDFAAVPYVENAFYCPGCNASPDDYVLPSVGCPCEKYGSGTGSLTQAGVEEYLATEEES